MVNDWRFRIQQAVKYYSYILVGEFATRFYSANAIPPILYKRELSFTNESIEKMLGTKRSATRTYKNDPGQLAIIAFSVPATFWTILIQYSKLIGIF